MKLCFSTLGCPDWSLFRIAERAKCYGFSGVELRIGGKKHIDPAMSSDERASIRRLFAESGLAIASVSGYTQFAGQNNPALTEQRDNLIENITLARDIGAPYVRTFIGEANGGRISPYGVLVLRDACEWAKAQGVMVLVETHDSLSTGKQAGILLNTIDSAGLGILWDMHHTIKAGETPEETYAALGAAIQHVHVKDAGTDHTLCLPGDGALPIGKVARVLMEHGYGGFLSFEWEKMWIPELQEPEVAFSRYIEWMQSLLETEV